MLESIFGRRRRSTMGAEEVRALRDEFDWTQEQLADALEVSPLEVSAWEAGAVPVRPDNAGALAVVAWRERRERAWDAAGARPCAWGADARARLEESARTDDLDEVLATRKLHEAHRKDCGACRRAAELEWALGPVPRSTGGLLGFVVRTMNVGERLPAPLSTLVGTTVTGAWLVLLLSMLTVVVALPRFIVEPVAGFEPSLMLMLQIMAVFFGWTVASLLWDEVYPAQTFRARWFKAATTLALVAVMALLGMDPQEQAGMGFLALIALGVRREHRERKEADARQAEQTPSPAADADLAMLPGARVEPETEPGAVHAKVEAGRYEH